jgi:ABC-type uncharacterized transport system permease subunit
MFLIGGLLSLARLWAYRAASLQQPTDGNRPGLALGPKICMYFGLVAAVALLLWRVWARGAYQAADNFDTLVSLAVVLALFVMYVQRRHPIRGLDWFVMPVVILLLLAAAFFGRHDFREYSTIGKDALVCVHWVTAYGGAVAFAIAAAGGAMYILTSRRLRLKTRGVSFANLERLNRLMMGSVTLGFALLTVGLITGFVKMFQANLKLPHLKLASAMLAWLVYAVVMHAPINPRFRGRRSALLSIFGFVLVAAVLIVVQYMPGGTK